MIVEDATSHQMPSCLRWPPHPEPLYPRRDAISVAPSTRQHEGRAKYQRRGRRRVPVASLRRRGHRPPPCKHNDRIRSYANEGPVRESHADEEGFTLASDRGRRVTRDPGTYPADAPTASMTLSRDGKMQEVRCSASDMPEHKLTLLYTSVSLDQGAAGPSGRDSGKAVMKLRPRRFHPLTASSTGNRPVRSADCLESRRSSLVPLAEWVRCGPWPLLPDPRALARPAPPVGAATSSALHRDALIVTILEA